MKETKIAKENVEDTKQFEEQIRFFVDRGKKEAQLVGESSLNIKLAKMELHKQTCQRWLEWITKNLVEQHFGIKGFRFNVGLKVTDLKQAIKIYKDNEI